MEGNGEKKGRGKMKIRTLFAVLVVFVAILAMSGVVSADLTIDRNIEIGTGDLCYSFVIFADPTSDITKLQEAVTWVNNHASSENIRFVIVLGDIIQGEKATAQEYENEYTNVNNNGMKDILGTLNVPYTPVIGNHDVWCNLDGDTLPGTTIPKYTDYPGNANKAPEQIFDTVFDPVYNQLATDLPGWTPQDGMPINNPYNHPTYPPTYFQNFAFDYGDYHFVCLDFCARDDFDPEIVQNVALFGYADLHDKDPSTNVIQKGTWKWLLDHLAAGVASGQISTENTIIFSHHPPDTDQRPTGLSSWPKAWYGFDDDDYNTITSALVTAYGNNIAYWFGGHREGYNFEVKLWFGGRWIPLYNYSNQGSLPGICPYYTVPSVEALPNYIDKETPLGLTRTYPHNSKGWLQIVKVRHPIGGPNLPDPFISPIHGDNPDIVLYKESNPGNGNFDSKVTYGSNLDPNRLHQIRATIRNGGCQDADVHINFTWSNFGIALVDQITGFQSSDGVTPPNPTGNFFDLNKVISVTIPSGETEGKGVYILWDSGKIFGGAPSNQVAHGCIRVRIEPQNGDIRPYNNMGQENVDVNPTKSDESMDTIYIPIPVYSGVILEVTPTEGRLWNATIISDHPHPIPPKSWGTAYLVLHPVQDLNVGDVENFRVTGRRADTGELIGGVEIASLIDDPPILEWAGNNGYASDGVEPDEGTVGTTFIFKVKYTDENNHAPTPSYPLLYLFKGDNQIQGSPFVMNEETSTDTDYTNGKIYTYSITLSEPRDDYTYFFWARDELEIVAEGPATNIMSGPRVFGAIPPEFIVSRINNSIYYFPYDETTNTFGSPVLIDTLGPCTGSPKIDGRVVDFDNDGDFDVLIDTSTWYVDRIELIVYENTGTTFVPAWQETQPGLGAAWGDNSFVVAGDFDEDGDWDFIQSVVNQTNSYTYDIDFYAWGNDWIPGGTLTFRPLLSFSINTSPIAHPSDMESADFDNDGHLDLLIGDYPHGAVHVGEAYLYTGNGRWGFVTPASPCIEVNTPHPQPIPAMVSGDFYRGLLPAAIDVIVGLDDDGDPGQTSFFSNDGTGVFSQVTMFPPNPWTPHEPFDLNKADEYPSYDRPGGGCMDAKDFNNDGVLDIVASGGIGFTNPLWYLRGLGSGTFGHACLIHYNAYLIAAPERPLKYVINETKYLNSITQPIDVSKICYKFKVVDEEWAAKWTTLLLYGQKETKYSIEIYLNKTGYVTRVDFERWGFPITEIPYKLAEQSLAKLPPGFAMDP